MTALIVFALVNVAAWCWVAWCGYGRAEGREARTGDGAPSQPDDQRELQVIE